MTVIDTTPTAIDLPHSGVDCDDVERLLADITQQLQAYAEENTLLRQRLTNSENYAMSLHGKMNRLQEDLDALREQNSMLMDELDAKDPLSASLDSADVARMIRTVTGTTRGPLPARMTQAVEAAAPEVRKAMRTAGKRALLKALRRTNDAR